MLKTRHCSVEIAGVSLPQEGPQAGCMVEDECSVLENPGRDPPPQLQCFQESILQKTVHYLILWNTFFLIYTYTGLILVRLDTKSKYLVVRRFHITNSSWGPHNLVHSNGWNVMRNLKATPSCKLHEGLGSWWKRNFYFRSVILGFSSGPVLRFSGQITPCRSTS